MKTDLLNQKEKHATRLIEATSAKFTELVGCSNMDQISAERLKSDFQRILQRFQRVQSAIKLRLLTRRSDPPVADLLGINSEDDLPTVSLPHQTGTIQTQLDRADHENVHELGYVLQQEDQMQSIEVGLCSHSSFILYTRFAQLA
ncbi:hypothetical protein PHET_11570 [Paragonimus heterotremus]|uniref:Syntaxin N-terminal domain-containing protein n=1 Tax=Paragonimus heterotremus TaxID=100268 RepID=A0A8J4T633_9TREM|nr:hypothetical protein PHET_11570 [Paragonimus heterotremus]